MTGAVYAAPRHDVVDSQYTLLLSTSLVEDRTFALDRFFRPPLDPIVYPGLQPYGLPSSFARIGGHLYNGLPPGTAILSAPFVATFRAIGLRPATLDDVYDRRAEARMQRIIAGLLMAVFVGVAYAGARAFLMPRSAALLALVAALGSPIWSTASRALWSHTWLVLLVTIVGTMLLWEERDGRRYPVWVMGTLLAWAFWVRPSAAPMIVGVGVFVLARDGVGRALTFAAGGIPWAVLFGWYSLAHFGTPVPEYYRGSFIRLGALGAGLAGTLVSPSRGLLVFCPVAAAVGFLTLRHRHRLPSPRLAALAAGVIVVHVLIAGASIVWWGGHSYGPRLHTDLVPWFVVLATLALAAAPAEDAVRSRRAVLAVLSLWGIAIHGWGAVEVETSRWNYFPTGIDDHTDRLWSWREAQFLAGLPGGAARRRLPPVPRGTRLAIGASPEGDPFVVTGWAGSVEGARWSQAREAVIAVPRCLRPCRQAVLFLYGHPLAAGARQRVSARVNGVPAGDYTVRSEGWDEIAIPLERSDRRVRELTLSLPDAVPVGDDALGIRVAWMELR